MLDIAIDRATTAWLGVHRRMRWSFEDPDKWIVTEGEKLAKFREIRNLIENKIRGWAARKTFPHSDREKRIFSEHPLIRQG